jgi:hypothetical protein
MRTARVILTMVALVILSVTPAFASHGGKHPTFKTSEVYFHCPGPTKVQAVNYYTDAVAHMGSPYSGWNSAPPSGSLQTGAGCGAVDSWGTTSNFYDAAFRGSFSGNLRSVTVRIHQALLGNARPAAVVTLRLGGDIDGAPIFPPGSSQSDGRQVTVTPVRGANGAVELFEFTITNLGYAEEVRDDAGNVIDVKTGGMAREDGDGTIEHQLTLLVGVHGGPIQDPSMAKVGAWTWDSTDAPGGLTFNPPTSAQATVAADLPT